MDDGEEDGGQLNRWSQNNRSLIIGVIAVASVLLLLLSYTLISGSGDEDPSEVQQITDFSGGVQSVMVNSSFLGNDVYIDIPWDADISKAQLRVSGSLPPERKSFEAGDNPIDLAVGDIDMDLLPDVVVLNYGEDNMMVMKNIDGVSLQKTRTMDVGTAPFRIELAQLNDDDYIDALVLSEDSRDLRVFINDQLGGFMKRGDPMLLPTLPSDLATIDVDGDGDRDALVSTTNDDSITIYLNDGNGNLKEEKKVTVEGNPKRMTIADMDLDGDEDVVVYNARDLDEYIFSDEKGKEVRWFTSVSVLYNDLDLTFDKISKDLRTQKGVSAMDAGDMNGDGYPDIAMANLGYHNVSYILSDGNGDFQRGSIFDLDITELKSMDPKDILLEDLDHDGDLDIWAMTKSADSVLSYTNDGNGNFNPFVQSFVGVNPTSFAMIDLDVDGDKDIVTSDWRGWDLKHGTHGTVSFLENMRDGIFRTYRKYQTGNSPRGVFARDIDLDGDPDISSANYFGSTVSILENDGLGRFFSDREYPIGLEPYAVVLEDFDNDGKVDGASADEANFRIVLLRSDGDIGFTTERFLYDIGAYPFSLRTDDINGDGYMDLYTSNYFQNSTTLMFNDGSGDFETMFSETKTVYLGNNMPYDSIMKDINDDGLNDLITVNRGNTLSPTDTITVMINDGTYDFTDKQEYTVGKEPTSAVMVDVDNDGDIDIATANTGDDTITVLLNDGNGEFSPGMGGAYEVGDRPQYINSLDVDRDGYMDLLVTTSDSNKITIFLNVGGQRLEYMIDLNIASYPYAIDLADFNTDGRDDIVLTSVNTNSVIVTGCYYYPSGVQINVGSDGTIDHSFEGLMTEDDAQEIDITDALKDYVKEHKVKGQDTRVPLGVISEMEGVVSLSNLLVLYS